MKHPEHWLIGEKNLYSDFHLDNELRFTGPSFEKVGLNLKWFLKKREAPPGTPLSPDFQIIC